MEKIPTLFVRQRLAHMARSGPELPGALKLGGDRRYVTPEVTPGCEWALEGEGTATRKYDGTCVMFDGRWWARREVKADREAPEGFVALSTDEVTGKTVGWEPVEQSAYARFALEAIAYCWPDDRAPAEGTYELVGPKVNKNPERYVKHVLVAHLYAEVVTSDYPQTFESLRARLTSGFPYEGIVWHHPDGRMAKLKRRDFPR